MDVFVSTLNKIMDIYILQHLLKPNSAAYSQGTNDMSNCITASEKYDLFLQCKSVTVSRIKNSRSFNAGFSLIDPLGLST